ncbi:MAG: adenylate/guanylate cyclase domain-containing protein [Chloroflexota bacterium]
MGRSGGSIQKKSFDVPDDVRQFPKGTVNLVHLGSVTMGRGILEPGFRWSTSLRPVQGTPSCQIHHLQLMVQGRFQVEMDDGETAEFGPGDVMNIPPGHDVWVVGDEPVVVVDVLGNIGALGVPGEHERLVTTLLMSDIVDSTRAAARLGDAAWKQVLAEHNRLIRAQLDRFRGREVNTTGDGFLATFASAAGAIRSAMAIRDAVQGLGIELRIGVHTGEVEVLPTDIGGVAVHAASRVMALGGASEIVVSSVTRDLVEASGLRFEDRGRHQVKGLERPIEVFLLAT